MSAFSAKVTGNVEMQDENSSKLTVFYTIEVVPATGEGWILHKRYSSFHLIFKELKEKHNFHTINEFNFPPKATFFQDKKDIILERQNSLDKFCEIILQLEPRPVIVEQFFTVDAEAVSLQKKLENATTFSALKIQCFARMLAAKARYKKRQRAHTVHVSSDWRCKQLLVANREELYHMFNTYTDKEAPVIKRKDMALFALNMKIVPRLLSREQCDQLVTDLVSIINEDPLEQDKIEPSEAPLHFEHFLRFLLLFSSRLSVSNENDGQTIATRFNILLQTMDDLGSMHYLGSKKLPLREEALAFDLRVWFMEKHFGPYPVSEFSLGVLKCKPCKENQLCSSQEDAV